MYLNAKKIKSGKDMIIVPIKAKDAALASLLSRIKTSCSNDSIPIAHKAERVVHEIYITASLMAVSITKFIVRVIFPSCFIKYTKSPTESQGANA
jgi:hypothetical protein